MPPIEEKITAEEEKVLQPDIEPIVPDRPKAPEPQPVDSSVAEDDSDDTAEHRPVDYGALKKERALRREHEQKAQELESQIAVERRLRAQFEQRYAEIAARAQQAQQPAPVDPQDIEPNKEIDPLGWSNWKLARVERQLAEIGQRSRQTEQQAQQGQAIGRTVSAYQAAARDFQAKTPDFKAAYDYLASQLDQELILRGKVDPAERMQMLQAEELNVVTSAMAMGENPAEKIYKIAKLRGFNKAPSVAQQLSDGVEAQTQASETDKLGALAAGQAASKTLGAVAGGASNAPQKYTYSWLSTLNGSAFDKAWKEMKERGKL